MNSLKKIGKIIKKSKSAAIFTHISPDCDALGSSFGLSCALNKLGLKTQIFVKEEFTPSQKMIFEEDRVSRENCNTADFDIFICVDASAINRLGEYDYTFDDKNTTIVLDHHVCDNFIAKYNYIESESSSCCEVIYKFIKILKVKIDAQIATYLYAGLSSDTSSFMNSNTNQDSFKVASELLKYGANVTHINQSLYQSRTLRGIEFQKYLLNNFKIINDCAYIGVDYETLKNQLNGKKSDCSGYSKNLINIKDINYSFSIVEDKPNIFSLSMRSKIGYDIRVIAEKLGGGGHVCAAGATFEAENINDALNQVLKAMNLSTEMV